MIEVDGHGDLPKEKLLSEHGVELVNWVASQIVPGTKVGRRISSKVSLGPIRQPARDDHGPISLGECNATRLEALPGAGRRVGAQTASVAHIGLTKDLMTSAKCDTRAAKSKLLRQFPQLPVYQTALKDC
jgi:hypothetical protein